MEDEGLFVIWNRDYLVGVEEIDAQHRKLFELYNKVCKSIQNSTELDLASLLEDLLDYVEVHFKTEEEITKVCRDFEDHKRKHISFINLAGTMTQDFLSTGDIELEVLLSFLKNWLITHIMGTDLVAFRWLRENHKL